MNYAATVSRMGVYGLPMPACWVSLRTIGLLETAESLSLHNLVFELPTPPVFG